MSARGVAEGPTLLAAVSVLVLTSCLFLVGNGSTTLWDRDEPEYAEAGREMAASGDLLVPSLWGKPFLEKPILIYWLIASAHRLFGDGEFAARFFPAICGAGSCVLIYLLGASPFGRRVGLLAAAILATAPQMAVIAKSAVTDSPLLFFILLSLASFAEIDRGSTSLAWWVGLYLGAAGAVLTKGLPGLVIIGFTIAGLLLWSRDAAGLRRLRLGTGSLVLAAVVGGWFLAANRRSGGELFRVALVQETLERMGQPFEGHTGGFHYYPLALLIGFYPWSAFLPQSVKFVLPFDRSRRLLAVWAAVTLAVFTVARTKLPHYILPAYPPLALLVAAFLVDALDRRGALAAGGWGKVTIAFLAGVPMLVVAPLLWAATRAGFEEILPVASLTGGLLLLVGVGSAALLARRRDALALGVLVIGSAGVIAFFAAVALPAFERYKISRPVAEAVLARASPQDRIGVFRFREPSLKFYLGGRAFEIESETDLLNSALEPETLWVVMPCDVWAALGERVGGALALVSEERGFNVSKGQWIRLCVAGSRTS